MQSNFADTCQQSYTETVIKAYIHKEITIADMMLSLSLGRSQCFHLINRFRTLGGPGLTSKKTEGRSNRSYPPAFRAEIMRLIRCNYSDFGPKFAAEKLLNVHGIKIGVQTLRRWMIDDGIWIDRKGREPKIHSLRPRCARRGELVQVDGSYHQWFEKRGDSCCLIAFIDDATSELKLLRMVRHETSFSYMGLLKLYAQRYGLPLALYSDRHSIFLKSNRSKLDEGDNSTQFSRACNSMGIKVICAETPQAKGRVERSFRTSQDRLVKELRLRNISTMDEANWYLDQYCDEHNERFAVQPKIEEDAHNDLLNQDLDRLLVYTAVRRVTSSLTVHFNKLQFVLENTEISRCIRGKRVTVAVHLDGEIEVIYNETSIPYRVFDKMQRIVETPIVNRKHLGAALDMAKAITNSEPHHFKRNNDIPSNFSKLFFQPNDKVSLALKNATKSQRQKHGGRSRGKLNQHPILVPFDRLSPPENIENLSNSGRPPEHNKSAS